MNKIIWTKEAEEIISAAPGFVQPMIRKMVETSARKSNICEISASFVEKARSQSGMGKKKPAKRLEDFFAEVGPDPLYAGFEDNDAIHAGGGSGKQVEIAGAWDTIKVIDEKSDRRALYLHIPFCVARCKFCSFYQSRTDIEELGEYASYIIKELKLVANTTVGQSIPINAVYFGGGTPTDLSAIDLEMILRCIKENYSLTGDCEITIEGRIHGFTDEKIERCLAHGVNRFSFGVQSFNTEIRQQMGRIDSKDVLIERINKIASYRTAMISVDLIYGLPDQTKELWLEDLKTVNSLTAIDSVSIYNLKNLPGSPIGKMVERGKLTAPANTREQADLYTITKQFFADQNVKRLGLRHWAFSNRERSMYNFIPKYNNSVIPIGNGAGGGFAGYRLYQKMKNEEYFEKLDKGEKPIAVVSKQSSYTAFDGDIVGSFEEFRQVNLQNLQAKYNDNTIISRLSPLLEQWETAGMVHWNGDSGVVRMTDAGEFYNVHLAQNLIDYNIVSLNEAKRHESIGRTMAITKEIITKIQEKINENESTMPAVIADELGVTERDVVRHLPNSMSFEVSGSEFENVWKAMTEWEKVTALVSNAGIIAEIKGKLSKGSSSRGYFNLFDKDAPLNGHIKADAIESIFFVSKPFMKLESHSVQFYTKDGHKAFGIYLGRNEKRQIIESVLNGYNELRKTYEN